MPQMKIYIYIYIYILMLILTATMSSAVASDCDLDEYKDWMKEGKDFSGQGAYELAVDCFDKAIESIGDCWSSVENERANAFGWKGWTLYLSGQNNASLRAYEAALSNRNKDWLWDGKGDVLYRMKRYGEAASAYDEAIAIDPLHKESWYMKGLTLGEMGRYDEAINALDNVLSIDPTYKGAWSSKGETYEKWGMNQSALAAYEKENEINPTSGALLSKADLQIRMGLYDDALNTTDRSIEQNPDRTSLWRKKGDILDIQGRYAQAIEAYNESIRIDKNDSLAWYEKANDLYNLSRYEEALESYDKAVEIGRMRIDILSGMEEGEWIQPSIERWERHIEIALDGKNKTIEALGVNPSPNISM